MSVTYKTPVNNFQVKFLLNRPKKISYFRCKIFCNEEIFQVICLNYIVWIIFVYRSIFSKNLTSNILKRKSYLIFLLTRFCVLYYLCKSKVSAHLHEVSRDIGVQKQPKNDGFCMAVHAFFYERRLTLTMSNDTCELY